MAILKRKIYFHYSSIKIPGSFFIDKEKCQNIYEDTKKLKILKSTLNKKITMADTTISDFKLYH